MHYLLKGLDRNKDQSYFLYRPNPSSSNARFSRWAVWKNPVRRLAAEFKLPTAAKGSSTGICFIGERSFRSSCKKYLPTNNGKMDLRPKGKTVGDTSD